MWQQSYICPCSLMDRTMGFGPIDGGSTPSGDISKDHSSGVVFGFLSEMGVPPLSLDYRLARGYRRDSLGDISKDHSSGVVFGVDKTSKICNNIDTLGVLKCLFCMTDHHRYLQSNNQKKGNRHDYSLPRSDFRQACQIHWLPAYRGHARRFLSAGHR